MGKRVDPMRPADPAMVRRAQRKRQKFETSNPGRMETISSQQFSEGKTFEEAGISPALAYRLKGYHENDPARNTWGQMELPGMTSRRTGIETGLISPHNDAALPDLAPIPPRWEEMHPHEQRAVLNRAREYGVTPESLHRALAAQVDQGHARAAAHGMTPYAAYFYSGDDPSRTGGDQPRDVLEASAKENGVPFSTQVLANAKTSPKTKFQARNRKTGEIQYPNNEAANIAVSSAQAGIPHKEVKRPKNLQALGTNIQQATYLVSHHLAGKPMDELRNPPSKSTPAGSDPFGPKTGPYANSFIDPHGSSQFFVSDVHSGGAGMAPHLSHESHFVTLPPGQRHLLRPTGEMDKNDKPKHVVETVTPEHPSWDQASPFALTKGGNRVLPATERETYLDIPGIHSLHDYVARRVMHERGLHSLSGMQGTQWGEEQVSRGEVNRGARKVTLVSLNDAYPKPEAATSEAHAETREMYSQPRLFEM